MKQECTGYILSWDERSRDDLRALCARTGVVDVAGGGADDLGQVIRTLGHRPVDVMLVDLDTAPGDPIGIVSILRSALPEGRIVVWADDVVDFEDLFDVGIDAWISRRADPGTLTAAVTGRVASGRDRGERRGPGSWALGHAR